MRRFLAAFLVCSACANVQVTPLNAPSQAPTPKPASEVEMYLTKVPSRAYEELYMIRSDAGNSEEALSAMRERAGALGCDALIIAGAADRVVSSPDAVGNSTVSMREGFLGSCVVFTAP